MKSGQTSRAFVIFFNFEDTVQSQICWPKPKNELAHHKCLNDGRTRTGYFITHDKMQVHTGSSVHYKHCCGFSASLHACFHSLWFLVSQNENEHLRALFLGLTWNSGAITDGPTWNTWSQFWLVLPAVVETLDPLHELGTGSVTKVSMYFTIDSGRELSNAPF